MSLKIICHMISSVDGRLLPARWTEPAQPLDVTEVYETAASSFPADGWLIGRTSGNVIIEFPGGAEWIGRFVSVDVTEALTWIVKGRLALP